MRSASSATACWNQCRSHRVASTVYGRPGVLKMKMFVAAIMAGAYLLMTAACNTVEGVGEDVSAAGKAIDRTAEDAKH